MQCRILPKWRYNEAEEQRDQHEDSRKNNLRQNAAIVTTIFSREITVMMDGLGIVFT